MPFNMDDGWGLATLVNKRDVANFVEYEFALPKKEYSLPLALGQQLTLCCLDDEDEVIQGNFFVRVKKGDKGVFRIVCPKTNHEFALGKDRAYFAKVLDKELDIGAEIAIKPGDQKLFYRGPYLPVTDMVYVAYGMGIIPILHQIQSILPSGSSSVKQISVLWINSSESDFDLCFKDIEKEFFKYNKKLEVSCILEDAQKQDWGFGNNDEIAEAVPPFQGGVMAVVSGPSKFLISAETFLRRKGYPQDCVCALP